MRTYIRLSLALSRMPRARRAQKKATRGLASTQPGLYVSVPASNYPPWQGTYGKHPKPSTLAAAKAMQQACDSGGIPIPCGAAVCVACRAQLSATASLCCASPASPGQLLGAAPVAALLPAPPASCLQAGPSEKLILRPRVLIESIGAQQQTGRMPHPSFSCKPSKLPAGWRTVI